MLFSTPRPSISNACGIVPASVTSKTTGPGGTRAGASWTFHSERLTLTVLGLGFALARPCGEAKQGKTRVTESRYNEPVRLTMLRAGRCGTAFMRYLRARGGILRITRSDLGGAPVIPGPQKLTRTGNNSRPRGVPTLRPCT